MYEYCERPNRYLFEIFIMIIPKSTIYSRKFLDSQINYYIVPFAIFIFMFVFAAVATYYCYFQRSHDKVKKDTTNDEAFPEEHIYAEVIYDEHSIQYDHLRFSYQNNGNSRNFPLNNHNQIHQKITRYHQFEFNRKINMEN